MKTQITKTKREKIFGAFSVLLIVVLFSSSVVAATWTVCTGGGCNYLTLSAAYASGSVASGDTLELHSNITDSLDLSLSKIVNITSQAGSVYTVTGTGTNPTLWIHPNFDGSAIPWTVTNVNWDHTTADGYTFEDDGRKAYVTFIGCTLQRSYSGGTNNSVIYTNADIESINFKQCTIIGQANQYGVWKSSGNAASALAMINLENCVLYGFTGTGAAIRSADNNNIMAVKMMNCTVFNNNIGYLDSYGGANNVLPALVQNTLFIGNTTDLSLAAGAINASRAHFQYNAFQQQQQTTPVPFSSGNIFGVTAANEVINPATSGTPDLHLKSGAQSIDTGTNTNAPSVDRDGSARPVNVTTDIGAYEFTPGLSLSKSANVTFAYLGDTVTYCLTYTNTSSSDKDTDIWDTVPANTLYLGCSGGCDLVGGTIVHWFLTIGSGYSGTLCFWVKVTGYPYFPTGKEYLACLRQREIDMFEELNWAYGIDKTNHVFVGMQD